MPERHDIVLYLSAPGVPLEASRRAQEELIREFNERAPMAHVVPADNVEGTKGVGQLIGQVGLALLSPDLLKYIAQVIVEFVKRNERYSVQVGDITINKDYASAQDVELINAALQKIVAQKQK